MNDVEVELFDELARKMLETYPQAYLSSEYVEAPPQFPAVSIIEDSNVTDVSGEDSSGREKRSAIAYAVNVYSNTSTAKQDCKDIMSIISRHMRLCNMTRTMCSVVDNARDPTVYRMIARFVGIVDENQVMYRR